MRHQDDEMPEEYLRNAAKLAEFLDAREKYRATLKDLPPHLQATVDRELPKLDQIIENLETLLAAEYERIQAERAKDAEISKSIVKGWEASKQIYIIIKHQTPHLLASFTKQVLDPMTEEDREEFLDGVAVLETTNLNAILKGEA